MTEPLVPPEVDLQDFAFMPLDVRRLRDSDLASEECPEACWAAVLIWCASWHQVPAGSIPDSELWQAKQAGYVARGKIDKGWAEVKAGALRNWIRCSDGRLYHPVIAEKVLEAWESRSKFQEKNEAKETRQQRWRDKVKQLSQLLRDAGVTPPMNASKSELERLCRLHVDGYVDGEASSNASTSASTGDGKSSTGDGSETSTGVSGEIAKTGTGTGTGTGIVKEEKQTATSPSPGTQVGDQPSINGLESPTEAREKRIREVATDAVETYNAAPFTKRNGGNCPNVTLVNDVRVKEVARCLKTAQEISVSIGRGRLLTRDFWAAYWESVNEDPFHSGQVEGKNGHANWKPDFEYLTRKEVMTKVFDRAMSEQGSVHG